MQFTSPVEDVTDLGIVVSIQGKKVLVLNAVSNPKAIEIKQALIKAGWTVEPMRDGFSFCVFHIDATDICLNMVRQEIEQAFGMVGV